jgi:hypothetical protein
MTIVTRAEYARHAGVNRSTVTRWIEAGRIPSRPDGLIDQAQADQMRDVTESPLPHHQARKAQIETEKAEAQATRNAQDATIASGMCQGMGADQIGQQNATQAATPSNTTETTATEAGLSVEIDLDKEAHKEALRLELLEIARRTKAARMRNEEATARDKEIDLKLKAGQLVWREEMDQILAEYAAADRVLIERFPERWGHEWVALGVPADKAAHLRRISTRPAP